MTTFLFLASVPISIGLQLYIWIAWRRVWRIVGSAPAMALISGAVHGLAQNSNLWPFWIIEFAPYSAGLGIALLVIRWLTRSLHGPQQV
jgi:hypothetical protein